MEKKFLRVNDAYDFGTLADWYINSVDNTQAPIWTEAHIEELLNDFYVIPKSGIPDVSDDEIKTDLIRRNNE